jgi:Protein of unknown function (DUF2839)
MGEAKRRAEQGLSPRPRAAKPTAGASTKAKAKPKDTSPRIAPWLPLTQNQGEQFVRWTTRGAWIGIGALVIFWVTVRFIGPAFGWWTLADG